MRIFIFHSFFVFLENEGREWMVIVTCEERNIIKKKKKIDILRIENLMPYVCVYVCMYIYIYIKQILE